MIELWCTKHDAYSHRTRIIVAEKDLGLSNAKSASSPPPPMGQNIGVVIKDIDINNKPEDLARLNPLNQVPVLVDKDVHFYESNIINEYLDERFPHPQLMPLSVIDRAKARLFMFQFDRQLYTKMDKIINAKTEKIANAQRLLLADALLELSQLVGKTKYLIGNDFTIADVALAPLLWRLEYLKIKLPPKAAPLLRYAENVFVLPSFLASLTPTEQGMRK